MANNTVIHSVEFTGDASKLQAACLQAAQAVAGLGNTAGTNAPKVQSLTNSLDKLGSKLSSFGSSLTIGLTAPLVLLGKQLFTNAASFEQIAVSFEVFTGSAEVAKNMLGQLKDMALKSPMQFQDITKGAQVLLGYGLTAEQVIPITERLGDISGGNSDKFQRLSLAFGQVNAAGRLMGQELRQMINAGFNPLQAMSDKTGESMASLTKRMHDGQVSVQEVADAMLAATSLGGRFYGMLDKQSQTLQGQFNKLQESVTFAFAEIGKSLADAVGVQQFFLFLSSTIETLKNRFLALSPETQSAIFKFGAFLALMGPASLLIGGVISSIVKLVETVTLLRKAILLLEAQSGIGIVIAIIGALGVAAVLAAEKMHRLGDEIEDTVNRANDAVNKFKFEGIGETINKLNAQIQKLERDKIDPSQGIFTEIQGVERIKELRKELEGLDKLYQKLNKVKFPGSPPPPPPSKNEEEIVFQYGKANESNANFILKKDREKYIELSNNAVLGYSAIQDIEKNYRDKNLAELYVNQQEELNILKKFGIDATAIKETHLKQRQYLEQIYAERGRGILINSMNNAIEINKKSAKDFEPSLDTTKIQFGFDEARIRSQADNLKRFGAEVYAAQVQVATQLAVGFSQIVGSVISGDLSIGDAFASLGAMFLDAIGGFLVQVGEAAIKAGIVKLIIENAFKGLGGGALIGIGMAAVAIGTAMQNVGKKTSQAIQAKGASSVSASGMSSATSSAIKSGSTYQSGSQTYGGQVVRLAIDLTGSITSTQTGYQINKSLETVLRVTGR